MIKNIELLTLFFYIIFFALPAAALTSSSYLIANAAISYGDYDVATEYYSSHSDDYSSISALKKQIISFVNTGKITEANLLADQIINIDKNEESAWLVKLVYAIKNNIFSDFDEFKKINNINQFKIINFIFYMDNELQLNIYHIAEKLFNIIETNDSLNLEYNDRRDYLLFYLNLAVYLKPNFYEALFFQAQILQELKYYNKAEYIYIKIKPSHHLYLDSQKSIALNKSKDGKFDEAALILNKLINDYPEENSLILFLADLYRINKEFNQAIKLYSQVLDTNDQLWRVYFMRGICYERLNKWKNAEKDFLYALEIEPQQPKVLNYLAYGWIEKNFHLDRSLNMLKIAAQKNPNSHYILDSFSMGPL